MLRYLLILFLSSAVSAANAQVEMADDFRGEGKIYVVIGIILILLAGFFFMLFKLDKRSKRLEDRITQSRRGDKA